MTAKEFLQRVFIVYQGVDSKLEQIARLQSLATRTTTVMRSVPCCSGTSLSSRVEQAIVALDGQCECLADEINHLLDVRRQVEEAIAKVSNPMERCILEYRYFSFKSWKEISHSMKVGLRTIYRLHDRAIKNFSAVTKCHLAAHQKV